jgi:hypothetical protein
MDYGYQLLRHVLQQVFGNLREAAQLTLLLFLAPFGLRPAGSRRLATGGMPVRPRSVGGARRGGLILWSGIVCYCWAAVGWHRYVLMEETGNGFLPSWRGDRVRAYFGRAFVVGLVI